MTTPEAHTPPAPASAAASEPAAAPAAASRRIPGLAPGAVPPVQQPKQRKRAPKKPAAASSSPSGPATPNPDVPIPLEAKSADNDKVDADEADELLRLQETKSNAAEVVQKRLRATTKKVQRIEGYEASTVALNPDQQRAVQGKPALQAVVRELTELSALLKSDDEENAARQQRLKTLYEKQQTRSVDAAVKIAQKDAQSKLVFLFQFLHLHSLVNPQQQMMMGGFAPAPELPAILESASSQDIAAVRYLADAFANGPLLGGGDDATEKLAHLFKGSQDEVLPGQGVSYRRVRYLVHDLTAPPASATSTTLAAEGAPETTQTAPPSTFGAGIGLGDLGDDIGASASVPGTPGADSLESDERERADQPAGPADSVVALVDGALEPEPHPVLSRPPPQQQPGVPTMSFLQPSEVDAAAASAYQTDTRGPGGAGLNIDLAAANATQGVSPLHGPGAETPRAEEKVQSWADDLAQDGQLPPPQETPTPLLTPTLAAAPVPAQTQINGHAVQPKAPTLDWAADDEDGGLPHLPELAPAVPLVSSLGERQQQQQQQHSRNGSQAPPADGFQPARPSRRGSDRGGRGGGSFDGRGRGMSSRGSFRGRGGRGGANGGPRGPNGDAIERPPRAEGGGDFVERRGSFRGGRGAGGGGGRGRGENRGGRGAMRGTYSTPVAPDAKA